MSPSSSSSADGQLRARAVNAGPEDVPKLFQCRDGAAFNALAATLIPLGYRYGTTIHFYRNDERSHEEFPALHANDLLALTTRPSSL